MSTYPAVETLPYLTAEVAPIAAAIKRRYEDFRVEEIPAYEPVGEGDHVYVRIEKTGIATMQAVQDIARALGVPARQVGLAGLKDARAVAVQTLSIEHVDPERVAALAIPRIKVVSVSRHRNKLKIGHLRGNRFCIRLRDVEPDRAADMQAICEILAQRGVPNYFGQQRFGLRGDTWEIGRAVMRGDAKEAIDLMLGRPGPHDRDAVLKARQLYEAGKFEAAAKAWPFLFRDNTRACRVLAKTGGNHKRALHALDARLKKFFVSAYQSHLFNRVLAERVGALDEVQTGDMAILHEKGAMFRVEDAAAEQPRAHAFEISATGPLFGRRMTPAESAPGQLEQAVLEAEGVRADDFSAVRGVKVHGSRRAVRFRPEGMAMETGTDEHGTFVELRFSLASGCYATMVFREICKDRLEEGLEESGDARSS